jgi:signal transduction histidine kinase
MSASSSQQVGWSLVMLAVGLPLIFRRRYPLATLCLVLAMAFFVTGDHDTLRLSFYVCVIAGYTAAVYSPYRLPALLAVVFAAFLYQQLQGNLSDPLQGPAIPMVSRDSVPIIVLVPIAIAADGMRRWRQRADAESERNTALAEAVRVAAAVERARIARELHDVVTHNVSVMVIQAGAARKVLDSAPEAAKDALLAVESSGREAMTELRHVMGLLTMEDESPALAPQPGLDRLQALVDQLKDAGLPVALTITGTPRPLPDGVDLAAYRVVQEALTNTVKHAAGAEAAVRVEHGEQELNIEVTDTGGQPSGAAGNGRGLIGLRERLAVYGGTVQAEPRLRGGFRVKASIPL